MGPITIENKISCGVFKDARRGKILACLSTAVGFSLLLSFVRQTKESKKLFEIKSNKKALDPSRKNFKRHLL